MARPESGVPTNDLAVVGFCELWGLILGLPPGEDLYHGAPVTGRMISFLVLGAAFAILGPAWPWLKTQFPRRLSTSFIRVASDFRAWMVLLLAFLFYPSSGTIQWRVPAWPLIIIVVAAFALFEVTRRRGSTQVHTAVGEARPATSERTSTSAVVMESSRDARADEDAEIMDQRIYYIELGPHNEELTGPQPYIDFYISLINASVFEITWEHEIEGLLHLDGHQLQQSLIIAPRDPPQQFQTARGRPSSIAIRQWLTRENVMYMAGREEIQFAFGAVAPRFSFNHRGQKHIFAKKIAMRNNNVIWKNPDWAHIQQSVRRLVTEVPGLVKKPS